MNELIGRTCLITGATGGFGPVIARHYWNAGASLMLTARSQEALAKLATGLGVRGEQRVFTCAADLHEDAGPGRIVDECRQNFRTLNVLVNNAGVQGPIRAASETTVAEWDHTFRVNLFAPVRLSGLCVSWMQDAGGGKIINLSGGGATSPRPRFAAYAASKAALVRFSETLAVEVKDFKIDVNCVAPGAMATPMLKTVLDAGPAVAGEREHDAARQAFQASEAVMERAAALCVFLASAASDGISGRLVSAVWDPWERLAQHAVELRSSDIYTLRRIVPGDRGQDWSAS